MPTDLDLLNRVADGDGDACEDLYARFSAPLRRHLTGLVRDASMAEDLLQEVFLRVWTRADQFAGRGSVRAWLYRIASNLAYNHLDSVRRRRQRPLEPSTALEDEEEVAVPGWMVDEAAISPLEELERSENSRLLRGAIDELSEDKRTVFNLVYDAEMEVRDVAEQFGIPEGTVKSRLFYARRQVADSWRQIRRQWEDSP